MSKQNYPQEIVKNAPKWLRLFTLVMLGLGILGYAILIIEAITSGKSILVVLFASSFLELVSGLGYKGSSLFDQLLYFLVNKRNLFLIIGGICKIVELLVKRYYPVSAEPPRETPPERPIHTSPVPAPKKEEPKPIPQHKEPGTGETPQPVAAPAPVKKPVPVVPPAPVNPPVPAAPSAPVNPPVPAAPPAPVNPPVAAPVTWTCSCGHKNPDEKEYCLGCKKSRHAAPVKTGGLMRRPSDDDLL